MSNPVAAIRIVRVQTGPAPEDSRPAYRSVMTYCPGCKAAHPFTVEVYDGYTNRQNGQPQPVWDWDGNLESPTFSPSMLCYSSVHLCPEDYVHVEECVGECEERVHGYAWKFPDGRLHQYKVDEERPEGAEQVLTHNLPHAVEPAWGNCHSFLRNGIWDFLSDSAHGLAGQKAPMVPLPNWLAKRGGD